MYVFYDRESGEHVLFENKKKLDNFIKGVKHFLIDNPDYDFEYVILHFDESNTNLSFKEWWGE